MDEDQHRLPALSAEQARTLVHSQFPEPAPLPVRWLGEGTDHRAFAVGERLVFRFPKHGEAAGQLLQVARLTAWLAPQLPLAVPIQRFAGQPGEAFPGSFSGEDRMAGSSALTAGPLSDEHARLLGHFLKRLHGLPADQAAGLGLEPDDDPGLEEWSADALDDLGSAVEAGQIPETDSASWNTVLLHPPVPVRSPGQVIHGDFAAEHVFLGPSGRPTGVIDWSDARLGDPAQDLAGLLHWGGPGLLQTALERYGPLDRDTWARARFYAICRALADLRFGAETGRAEYVEAGRRALNGLNSS